MKDISINLACRQAAGLFVCKQADFDDEGALNFMQAAALYPSSAGW